MNERPKVQKNRETAKLDDLTNLKTRIMTNQEAYKCMKRISVSLDAFEAILDWTRESHSYLSDAKDYAKGYKDGIAQAKEVISELVRRHFDKMNVPVPEGI